MRPVWGALPYAMCKAAVDQFTRCTSQGLLKTYAPIHFNNIMWTSVDFND